MISNGMEQSQTKSSYFSISKPFLTNTTTSKIDQHSNTEKTTRKISITSEKSILSDAHAKFVSPKINIHFIHCKEVASLSPLTAQKEITTTTTAATASTNDPDALNNIYLMLDQNTDINQSAKTTSVIQQEKQETRQVSCASKSSEFSNQNQSSNFSYDKSFTENLDSSRKSLTSSKFFLNN
jgi:hypothetical protein